MSPVTVNMDFPSSRATRLNGLCDTISRPGSELECRESMRIPVVALLGFLAVLLSAADCGDDGKGETEEAALQVRGVVTDVQARSLLELESLQVVDEQNTVWEFRPGPQVVTGTGHDYTPSHLRQHMVQGVPIIVTYTERDGVLTIVSISE